MQNAKTKSLICGLWKLFVQNCGCDWPDINSDKLVDYNSETSFSTDDAKTFFTFLRMAVLLGQDQNITNLV